MCAGQWLLPIAARGTQPHTFFGVGRDSAAAYEAEQIQGSRSANAALDKLGWYRFAHELCLHSLTEFVLVN